MGFQPNNNFNNMNNNQGGEKKKTNFRIGKIWGADGQLDVSVWVADTGARTILSIKSAVKILQQETMCMNRRCRTNFRDSL